MPNIIRVPGGGQSKFPSDLAPLCPNFVVERKGTKVKISADKIQLNSLTSMVAGGAWAWGKTRPVKPTGENTKQWSRAELITTGKPYDGLYLGDVTPSDAVTETLIYLPENDSGSVKLVPFIVLGERYGGITCAEVYVGFPTAWDSSGSHDYEGSNIDTYYTGTYLNSVLHESVVSQLIEAEITVRTRGSSGNTTKTIKRKAFTLSRDEYGLESDSHAKEGEPFTYFSSAERRKASQEGKAVEAYHTRTLFYNSDGTCWSIDQNGNGTGSNVVSAVYPSRATIVLPKDFKIQQRPDGSYTVWNEQGLMTLADVEPSSDTEKVSLNICEVVTATQKKRTRSFVYASDNYEDTSGALAVMDSNLGMTETISNAQVWTSSDVHSKAEKYVTAKGASQATGLTYYLDPEVQALLLEPTIKYRNASGGIISSKEKCFPLSAGEVNATQLAWANQTGTALPYFSVQANRVMKNESGAVVNYWLRDSQQFSGGAAYQYFVTTAGAISGKQSTISIYESLVFGIVLPLNTPIRALADGTYDLVPEDPALSAQAVSTLAAAGTPVQLKDIPVSDSSIKRTLILPEGENGQPFIYLSSNYNESGRGMMLREFTLPDSSEFSAFGVWRYDGSMVFQKIANWFDTLPSTLKKWIEPIDVHFRNATGYTSSSQLLNTSVKAPAFLLAYKNMGYSAVDSSYYGELMPYFTSDARRKAFVEGTETPATYWLVDAHSKYDAFNSGVYFHSIATTGGADRNDFRKDPAYIRPAITLPLDVWFIDNGDDTYTFLGDAPTPDLSIEIDWPESDPLIARQWVYNTKGQYQTMLLGGVASTDDAPAEPELDLVFGNNSWTNIGWAVKNNAIPTEWQIGDGKDEVIEGETLTFAILDFNHDDKADGSGKAPITMGMPQLMAKTQQMASSAVNANAGGYTASLVYSYLSDLFDKFPEELKSVIVEVNKKTSAGEQSTTIDTNAMNLFPFSEIEIMGSASSSVAGEGTQYPYYSTTSNRIKKLANGTGNAQSYWTRSPWKKSNNGYVYIESSGIVSALMGNTNNLGISFGFCIG